MTSARQSFIKYTFTGLGFKDAADHTKEIAARALRSGLDLWREKFFPLHFKNEAKRRYHYTARLKAYEIRKAKQTGHRLPLIGIPNPKDPTPPAVETLSRKPKFRELTGTEVGQEIILPTPKHIFQRRAREDGTREPRKQEELEMVTVDEIAEMVGAAQEFAGEAFDQMITKGVKFEQLKTRRRRFDIIRAPKGRTAAAPAAQRVAAPTRATVSA